MTQADKKTLYLIYDDECPLCRSSAHALNIKKAVGNLVLINARESHPLVKAAYERGFDPDRGIIVIYNGHYYFGADASHFLAMLNSPHGFINKITANLFRIHFFATIFYPVIKFFRRFFITMKGVGPVKENKGLPLFADVFGDDWSKLSPFMQKRFGNRPYSNDVAIVNGTMTIKSSRWMKLLKPFLMLSGALVQQDGENIPVTVKFKSELNSAKYWLDREFKFNPPLRFKSYMMHVKKNIMVEYMRFNIGWRIKFSVNGNEVLMSHHGYVLRFFNLLIPVPVALLIGKCTAIERQISDNSFFMEMSLDHFLFGKIYEYKGVFKLEASA